MESLDKNGILRIFAPETTVLVMRFSFFTQLAAALLLVLPACREARNPATEWETALRDLDRSLAQEARISQVRHVLLADAGFLGQRSVQFPQGGLPFRRGIPSLPAGGKEEKEAGREQREE